MTRAMSTKTLLEKKTPKFVFSEPYLSVMGNPGTTGIWLVYGSEKHGKTWFSVKLAEYMATHAKTLYVSAEEGLEDTFIETCKRASIDLNNRKLTYLEYLPLDELDTYLSRRQSPKVIFIDNMTIYNDELKNGGFRQFTLKHSDKLFVFIAHEEKKEPVYSTGKMCKRLAKIIIRVVGLTAFVSGRCPGGSLAIDEQRARLYHGINENE